MLDVRRSTFRQYTVPGRGPGPPGPYICVSSVAKKSIGPVAGILAWQHHTATAGDDGLTSHKAGFVTQ